MSAESLLHFGPVVHSGAPLGDTQSRTLFVGYSVRNRRFTRQFFERALQLGRQKFRNVVVAILDVPYAYNDAARRGESAPSEAELKRAITIGDERAAMVARATRALKVENVSVLRWDALDDDCARTVRAELVAGVARNEKLSRRLLDEAAKWLRDEDGPTAKEFLGFQLAELPVLISAHYHHRWDVDLYPGGVSHFLVEIERGEWSDILPLATALARRAGLTMLNVIDRAATVSVAV